MKGRKKVGDLKAEAMKEIREERRHGVKALLKERYRELDAANKVAKTIKSQIKELEGKDLEDLEADLEMDGYPGI